MQRHVALRRRDRVVVRGSLVMRVGRHDQRLARPFRIGVLAVDFLEALGGLLVVLLVVQKVEALIVELVGRIVRNDVLLAEKAACRQGHDHEREREQPCGLPPSPTGHDLARPHRSKWLPIPCGIPMPRLSVTQTRSFRHVNMAIAGHSAGNVARAPREGPVRRQGHTQSRRIRLTRPAQDRSAR